MLVFGWVRNKQGRTGLGTSNEKQKNDKMGTITGTLAIELAWNKQKKLWVPCTRAPSEGGGLMGLYV